VKDSLSDDVLVHTFLQLGTFTTGFLHVVLLHDIKHV